MEEDSSTDDVDITELSPSEVNEKYLGAWDPFLGEPKSADDC